MIIIVDNRVIIKLWYIILLLCTKVTAGIVLCKWSFQSLYLLYYL